MHGGQLYLKQDWLIIVDVDLYLYTCLFRIYFLFLLLEFDTPKFFYIPLKVEVMNIFISFIYFHFFDILWVCKRRNSLGAPSK